MNRLRHQQITERPGFTLVELLIYVAVFSVLVGGLATFVTSMQAARLRSQTVFEVQDQGENALRMMTQAVRNGTAITTPAVGANGATLSLTTPDGATSPTTFSLSNGVLQISEGAGGPIALTNNQVTISQLIVTNVSHPSTPGVVQIQFTVTSVKPASPGGSLYAKTYYGSAAIR